MKLWLDDVRAPPDDSWTWVKNAVEAMHAAKADWPTHVSLDHDLGDNCPTCYIRDGEHLLLVPACNPKACSCICHMDGHIVAIWLTAAVLSDGKPPPYWACHSMNPVGRARIENVLRLLDDARDRRARKGGDE